MPHNPSVKKLSVDHSFRLVLTWDLEFDITDANLDFEAPAEEVPLKGDWTVAVMREDDLATVSFRHDHAGPVGALGTAVGMELELSWVDAEGKANYLSRTHWDPCALPERDPDGEGMYTGCDLEVNPSEWVEAAHDFPEYKPETHRNYRFVATFRQAFPPEVYERRARHAARCLSDLHLEQLPHDVRLFFPHAHTDGAELWTKYDVLSRSSPYLKDLLASDFAESKLRRSKRARTSGAVEAETVETVEEKDYPDSDDETDTFLFSKRPPKLERSSQADDISYRQITITQTAFSTYHAILIYIHTGFIHFTPLSSSFPSPEFPSRTDFLQKSLSDIPDLPLPVSPNSAYRLAHLLQFPVLQERALEALRSSLTVSNAAAELFSPASIAYDDLRKVILSFVKDNWKVVQKSEGWKEAKEAIKAREATLEQAAVLAEVLEAVAEE
ncbi:hypothetical protein JCM6882_005703 [Rhodosporidiobolus microsporus]